MVEKDAQEINDTLDAASSVHESETDTIQDIEQDYQEETKEIAIVQEQNNQDVEEEEEIYNEVPSLTENLVEIEKIIVPKLDFKEDVDESVKEAEVVIENENFEKQPDKPEELYDELNTDFNIDIDKTYSNSLNTEENLNDDTQNDSFDTTENDENTTSGDDNFNQNEIDAESTRLNFFPVKNFQSCK